MRCVVWCCLGLVACAEFPDDEADAVEAGANDGGTGDGAAVDQDGPVADAAVSDAGPVPDAAVVLPDAVVDAADGGPADLGSDSAPLDAAIGDGATDAGGTADGAQPDLDPDDPDMPGATPDANRGEPDVAVPDRDVGPDLGLGPDVGPDLGLGPDAGPELDVGHEPEPDAGVEPELDAGPPCDPTPEWCDGEDTDCDGRTDEGALCPDGAGCVDGACVCDLAGSALCAADCVDPDSDPDHCGGCFAEFCDGVCVDGACEAGCPEGRDDCEGACVDLSADPLHCGACGRPCEAPPHMVAECIGGGCAVPVCVEGYVNVDRQRENGCECALAAEEFCNGTDDDCDGSVDEGFDLASDRRNCGACGRVCPAARNGGAVRCVDGACQREGECDDGWHDLDDAIDCEYRCDASGPEEAACDGVDEDCDGVVDEGLLESDPENCGACGVRCVRANADTACRAGRCVILRCHAGLVDADGDARNGCELIPPEDPAIVAVDDDVALQAALARDDLAAGTIIEVAPNAQPYGPVTITSSVHLVAADPASPPVYRGDGDAAAVRVLGEMASVSGCVVDAQGAPRGVELHCDGCVLEDCEVSGVRGAAASMEDVELAVGIEVRGAGVTVRSSVVHDIEVPGVDLLRSVVCDLAPNAPDRFTAPSSAIGIDVVGEASSARLDDNTVHDLRAGRDRQCTVRAGAAVGIRVGPDTEASVVGNTLHTLRGGDAHNRMSASGDAVGVEVKGVLAVAEENRVFDLATGLRIHDDDLEARQHGLYGFNLVPAAELSPVGATNTVDGRAVVHHVCEPGEAFVLRGLRWRGATMPTSVAVVSAFDCDEVVVEDVEIVVDAPLEGTRSHVGAGLRVRANDVGVDGLTVGGVAGSAARLQADRHADVRRVRISDLHSDSTGDSVYGFRLFSGTALVSDVQVVGIHGVGSAYPVHLGLRQPQNSVRRVLVAGIDTSGYSVGFTVGTSEGVFEQVTVVGSTRAVSMSGGQPKVLARSIITGAETALFLNGDHLVEFEQVLLFGNDDNLLRSGYAPVDACDRAGILCGDPLLDDVYNLLPGSAAIDAGGAAGCFDEPPNHPEGCCLDLGYYGGTHLAGTAFGPCPEP